MTSIDDKSTFAAGQRLTRGELLVARGCLVVTAILLWAVIDFIAHGWTASGAAVAHLNWFMFFLLFGFACIVATHGKWKLTLAASLPVLTSVALWWAALITL